MKKVGTDHVNLDQKVYSQLKSMILDQNLKPGTKIYQEKLALDLGISRTPVREAINRLEKEGLVQIFPQRGAYVVQFTEKDVFELFLIRENLEGLAARLASQRMTQSSLAKLESCTQGFREPFGDKDVQRYAREDFKFHQSIVNLSDAQRLIQLVSSLHDHIRIYRLTTRGVADKMKSSLAEHRQIIEALGKGDPEESDRCMRQHIRRVRDGVMENIQFFLLDGKKSPPKEEREWGNSAISSSKKRPKSYTSEP